MAIGILIRSVSCAAALMRFTLRFSQYRRAGEIVVFVSQYGLMSSSASSLLGVWSRSAP